MCKIVTVMIFGSIEEARLDKVLVPYHKVLVPYGIRYWYLIIRYWFVMVCNIIRYW